eukprot:UN26902
MIMFLKIDKKIKFLRFIMNDVPDYFHHFSQHNYVDQVLTKFISDIEQMYLLSQKLLDILIKSVKH